MLSGMGLFLYLKTTMIVIVKEIESLKRHYSVLRFLKSAEKVVMCPKLNSQFIVLIGNCFLSLALSSSGNGQQKALCRTAISEVSVDAPMIFASLKELEMKIPELSPRDPSHHVASQNSQATSFDGRPLVANGLSLCTAVLFRNTKNGKVILAHLYQKFYMQDRFVFGDYKNSLHGLGEGPVEAIVITGGNSRGVEDIQARLRSQNVHIKKWLQVSDGEWAWAMSYRPEEDKLYIQRRDGSRIIVESANGFGSIFPKQSYASVLSSHPHFLLDSAPMIERQIQDRIGTVELQLRPPHRIESLVEDYTKDKKFLDIVKGGYLHFKRALEYLRENNEDAAYKELNDPAYLKFIENEGYWPLNNQPIDSLLFFGETKLLLLQSKGWLP